MSLANKWRFLRRFGPRAAVRIVSEKAWKVVSDRLPYTVPAAAASSLTLNDHSCSAENLSAWSKEILLEADAVMCGHLECFGRVEFIDAIPWDTDVYSGVRWLSGRRASTYKPFTVPSPEDGKVPYELSRCHHLLPLAKAALVTGDRRYITRIESDIESWWLANPPGRSVNWTCSMDVAIRAVNWILAIEIAGGRASFSPAFLDRLARSLYQHGLHIWRNLEDYYPAYNTNHYLSNLVGLIYISSCFNPHVETVRWRSFSEFEFLREVRLQFLPSGPNYELSTSYHRLSTELVLSALWRLERSGMDIPVDIRDRMKRAIEYTAALLRGDGTIPQVGDNDDGRLHILGKYHGWSRHDHRYLVSLGAAVLHCDHPQIPAPDQHEATVLTGRGGELAKNPTLSLDSIGYDDAGMYILRNPRYHIVIKCSNVGLYGTAGPHNHNDVLSFDLAIDGLAVFVDPGTGQYTGNIVQRNFFRSTRAHNTVMIDGIEQNEIGSEDDLGSVWSLGIQARTRVLEWETGRRGDRLVAEHNGYLRLDHPIIHRRRFSLTHGTMAFEICDQFMSGGEHTRTHNIQWSFILHPEVAVQVLDPFHFDIQRGASKILFESEVAMRLEEGLYSPSYKRTVPTMAIRCNSDDVGREYRFTVQPGSGGSIQTDRTKRN